MAKVIDITRWKEFTLGELFDIEKGTRLTKAQMTPGDIKFIGASAVNNGWTASIGNEESIHNGNVLTVCYNGSVGETFYQEERFWASDDVNVLKPKFLLTKEIALFLCTIIRKIGKQYAFINKWRLEDMKNEKIKLPVKRDGTPDWDSVTVYMKSIIQKTANLLSIANTYGQTKLIDIQANPSVN